MRMFATWRPIPEWLRLLLASCTQTTQSCWTTSVLREPSIQRHYPYLTTVVTLTLNHSRRSGRVPPPQSLHSWDRRLMEFCSRSYLVMIWTNQWSPLAFKKELRSSFPTSKVTIRNKKMHSEAHSRPACVVVAIARNVQTHSSTQ